MTNTKQNINNNLFLIVLGVIVIAFAFYFLSNFGLNKNLESKDNKGTALVRNNKNELNERIKVVNIDVNQILGTLPPLGNPQAIIKIVEFGDFHCPFCAQVPEKIFSQLKSYIDQGLIAIYFRDFPLDSIHPFSRNVHLASRCANEQGKYWKFQERVFSDFLSGMGQKTGDKDYLLSLSKQLQLDENKFKLCYENKKYEEEINDDYNAGVQLGVQGTPAFFVNNLFIAGLDPEAINSAINFLLKNKK